LQLVAGVLVLIKVLVLAVEQMVKLVNCSIREVAAEVPKPREVSLVLPMH
jgi:hypothetical protein